MTEQSNEKAQKRYRFRWQRAWRSRPCPYWFYRVYPDGAVALHVGPVEVFRRATSPGSTTAASPEEGA